MKFVIVGMVYRIYIFAQYKTTRVLPLLNTISYNKLTKQLNIEIIVIQFIIQQITVRKFLSMKQKVLKYLVKKKNYTECN